MVHWNCPLIFYLRTFCIEYLRKKSDVITPMADYKASNTAYGTSAEKNRFYGLFASSLFAIARRRQSIAPQIRSESMFNACYRCLTDCIHFKFGTVLVGLDNSKTEHVFYILIECTCPVVLNIRLLFVARIGKSEMVRYVMKRNTACTDGIIIVQRCC